MIEHAGFAYCPRCGAAAIESCDKKAMRCHSCDFVYYHNTASAVAAIIEMDGGFLLTVRAREPKAGFYDCPGGFVDHGESIEEALLREVREELGIDVVIGAFMASFPNRYVFRDVAYFTTDAFFICRPAGSEAEIVVSDEIRQWEIIRPDRIPFEKLAFESNVKALTRYRELCSSR